MAINTNYGGKFKPVAKNLGILHYCVAGTVDVATLTATTALNDTAWVDAGGITTDGITLAENPNDSKTYDDWSGNTYDSDSASSAPTVEFAVLDVKGKNAMALVFDADQITAGADGKITAINGDDAPGDTFTFVIDMLLKGEHYRIVYPSVTFAALNDGKIASDELASYSVKYNVLTPASGKRRRILVG